MSLSSAMDTAKSSLLAAQTQTAVLSRNIANVNTAGATKKYANVVTGAYGQVTVSSITQSSNTVLFRNVLESNAALGKGNVIANGLNRVAETLGDTELSRSPAALVSSLGDALSTLSASPNNYELARNAVTAASDLVTSLNNASLTVQTVRRDADNELAQAAAEMTKILAKIEELNNKIVQGTRVGNDVTDFSDQRDQQVIALSAYVGVTSQTRGDNDLVLYTDSGVTLFETKPRTVEFSPTAGINESVTTGNAFRIDGMVVTGENAYMPIKSGSVSGLIALRDDVMVTYQNQLDEIARGLVAAFAESDPSGVNADVSGLFTSLVPPSPLILSETFSPGTIQSGDRLNFDVQYGNETYKASYVFPTGIAAGSLTDAQYRTALQTAIDTAVSTSGSGALGSGKVVVGGTGTAVTISALGAAAYSPFALSNISGGPNDPAKGAGIVTNVVGSTGLAATGATVSVGSFDGSAITNGETLSLTFSVDGTTYQSDLTFTGPMTAAEFQTKLQLAINSAPSVPAGTVLGSGKVAFAVGTSAPFTMSLTSVGTGAAKSLAVSAVTTATTGMTTATLQSGADATKAVLPVGSYAAGTIAAGDTLSFDFVLSGTTYRATHTFTAAPANAAVFDAAIQAAVNAATSVPGGASLGAGKVTIDIAANNDITLSTAVPGAQSLTLTSVTAVAGGNGDSSKTGGLVAASELPAVTGLANLLRLGAGVVADPTKIRDGVVYDYNTANSGGFTTRLSEIDAALSASRAFSATSGADPSASVADYASSSVSWLQANRQEYLSETEYKTTLLEQTQKALSNETGINMEEELAKLIEIERSFQASSKLISTIDEMLQTLLNSI